MIPKIKILAPDQVLKIAAGEVVRRPSSIVKELIENSIDALAKNITLKIVNGGSILIEIADDGVGMNEADAKLAIIPHATSKISKIEDLDSILTFGFRGEAIASVAVVSDLEIKTQQVGGLKKIRLFYKTGKLAEEEYLSPSEISGTKISVHNLFYNLPVRKKFLKSIDTETNQIKQVFVALALTYPEITFKFFDEKKMILNALSTQDLKERVSQIFDYQLAKNMLEFDFKNEDFSINGLTSNLQITRYNKSGIWLFVNNRFINDSKVSNAIVNAYDGALPAGRFPFTIIFINIASCLVDVNVHPAKEEVVFLNHGKVLSAIKEVIHRALNNQVATDRSMFDSSIFSNDQKQAEDKKEVLNFEFDEKPLASSFGLDQYVPLKKDVFENLILNQQKQVVCQPLAGLAQERVIVLGQLFSTYILFQKGDSFGMVDQHAASERILYEDMKKNYENLPKVKLLFPIICDLEQEALVSFVLGHQDIFESFGIEFSQIGKSSISACSLPANFMATDLKNFFTDVASKLISGKDPSIIRKLAFEHIHSHLACKTAIKAGDQLSHLKMEALLSRLYQVDNRFQCIHGRPTIHEISKFDVEKWFKR